MRNRYLYITLLAVLGFHQETLAQMIAQSPKLVVSITIDQLSAEQLETFAPLYSGNGLRRLLEQGRVYTNASYSFTPVDRASAIASLSTGSTPYYNGIPSVEWLDRKTLRPTLCVRDNQYGNAPSGLLTSTLGDEMVRHQRRGGGLCLCADGRCCHFVRGTCRQRRRMASKREMGHLCLLHAPVAMAQRLHPHVFQCHRCQQERDRHCAELL